ncbi:hypothetical protein ABT354_04935 [Streptomyces sp. NPDC000594]|uniref:hypothetical protein n=1 Tax=Streptomyces sp. NPDC000594 TaxID=3154261 RepID=UPI003326AEF1
MTTTPPLGPLDFQLVLLRRMADFHPGPVEDARRELGSFFRIRLDQGAGSGDVHRKAED